MKFLWKISENSQILSEVFFMRYTNPEGFDFDSGYFNEN